jgi:hypothetical protein
MPSEWTIRGGYPVWVGVAVLKMPDAAGDRYFYHLSVSSS